jgi:hypothetical protein
MLEFLRHLQAQGWALAWAIVYAQIMYLGFMVFFWWLRQLMFVGPLRNPEPEPYISFGTELFALLVTIDVAIVFGLVQAWRLAGDASIDVTIPTAHQDAWEVLLRASGADWRYTYFKAAAIYIPLTIYICVVALHYERKGATCWYEFVASRKAGEPYVRRQFHLDRYLNWLAAASVLRWTIGWLHLLWIVRAPKWSLFL